MPPRNRRSRGGSRIHVFRGIVNDAENSSEYSGFRNPRDEHAANMDSSEDDFPTQYVSSLRELPDSLIDFATQEQTAIEPPQKKQKRTTIRPASDYPEVEYITVKLSKWDIKCSSSKLSQYQLPIERSHVRPYVHWVKGDKNPEYLEITDEMENCSFHARFPDRDPAFDDVRLALEVDQCSKKWEKGHGRVWTEFGLQLMQEGQSDLIRMTFAIKWSLTTHPQQVMPATFKIPVLSKILDRYFPNPDVTKTDEWSPQDFYQSVYAPDKHDQAAASMNVDVLNSDLFPFQKRTVQWLLKREGAEWSASDKRVVHSTPVREELPLSFMATTDELGKPCYVSHLFGLVATDVTPFRLIGQGIKGGILAEEMGLGKTG
jgi:E3 ubiquitin-protein ligase SHPRH